MSRCQESSMNFTFPNELMFFSVLCLCALKGKSHAVPFSIVLLGAFKERDCKILVRPE